MQFNILVNLWPVVGRVRGSCSWVVFSLFIAMALCGSTKIRTNYFPTSGSMKRFPKGPSPVIFVANNKHPTAAAASAIARSPLRSGALGDKDPPT